MESQLPQFLRKRIKLTVRSRSLLSNKNRRLAKDLPVKEVPKEEAAKPANTPSNKLTTAPKVLVINASNVMAKSITRHLKLSLPNCSIVYAPTIELAGWMLKRHKISLIISSEVMPDGGAQKLQRIVTKLDTPPDVVMVGSAMNRSVSLLRNAGYRLVSRRVLNEKRVEKPTNSRPKLPSASAPETTAPKKLIRELQSEQVKALSADLRNDLNNPLQEIVTLAFVVRQAGEKNQITEDAIDAIESAAKQMAGTVNGLEDRIQKAVG